MTHEVSRASPDNTKRDLAALKFRLDKLEKSLATLNAVKPKNTVTVLIESITSSTVELNAKTVEVCAIISFFILGAVISATIFDRLWLFGGICASWWAGGAVHENSRAGAFTRRVGVQLAQLVRDLHEKVNQARIFYQTGRFAYHSSKMWEQYDGYLQITQRMDLFKRLAMMRAAEFNGFLGKRPLTGQLADAWRAVVAAPEEMRRLDSQYGLSSGLLRFGGHLYNSANNFVTDLIDLADSEVFTSSSTGGSASSSLFSNDDRARKRLTRKSSTGFRFFPWTRAGDENKQKPGVLNLLRQVLRRRQKPYRSRLVNPWVPFWETMFSRSSKEEEIRDIWQWA